MICCRIHLNCGSSTRENGEYVLQITVSNASSIRFMALVVIGGLNIAVIGACISRDSDALFHEAGWGGVGCRSITGSSKEVSPVTGVTAVAVLPTLVPWKNLGVAGFAYGAVTCFIRWCLMRLLVPLEEIFNTAWQCLQMPLVAFMARSAGTRSKNSHTADVDRRSAMVLIMLFVEGFVKLMQSKQ